MSGLPSFSLWIPLSSHSYLQSFLFPPPTPPPPPFFCFFVLVVVILMKYDINIFLFFVNHVFFFCTMSMTNIFLFESHLYFLSFIFFALGTQILGLTNNFFFFFFKSSLHSPLFIPVFIFCSVTNLITCILCISHV